MKIVLSDANKDSRDIIYSHLNKIEGIDNVYCYDNLSSIDCDLKKTDIVIFDINSNNAMETLVIVNEFRNKNKNLKFIATSYEINSELVSKVLKENVSDFLIKPILPNILSVAIKKIADSEKETKEKKAKTICVYSNKGGCGKTSIACNLAYEMTLQSDEKVCLLDLSFNFGDIATYLDLECKYNMLSVVQKIEHADKNLVFTLCEKYRNSNLYVLSFLDDITLKSKRPTPEVIVKLINSLKNIFDYIIIDCTSTIDEITNSIINASNLILLIGILNMASIRNCQKCLELFNNMGISSSKIKLVLNRYIENSEIKADDFKNVTGHEVFHKIPNNYLTLIDAINVGHNVSEINPYSNIAKGYQNLARKIISIDFVSLEDSKNYNHGVFNLLRRMGE